MAKCKACGAPIIFIRTQGGKKMPCDPEQRMYWQRKGAKEKIVTPNGEVINCALDGETINNATGIGYVPHWATCPHSDKFKRGGWV